MNYIKYISDITSIEPEYIILLLKSIGVLLVLSIIKHISIKFIRTISDNKIAYSFTKQLKIIISILQVIFILLIWIKYLSHFVTIISFTSAGLAFALRDLILNWFCGIYIRVAKPFKVEDRIEINKYKGDVVDINTLSFELLEVNNDSFIGQSTGVITHVPNSTIFTHPLRNYNKAFKYIWNELVIKIDLDSDIEDTKGVIYRIINSNDIIKSIPSKIKRQINDSSNDYRIYYNNYNPTIYTQIVNTHIELTVRYLIHPKKARYVNSVIWNKILESYQNKEINLYKEN